jgi:O-antigen/teichoic acid export membrane protein
MNNKNTIYNLLGNFIPIIVSILALPYYLNIIGNTNYGILSFLLIILTLFSLLDIGLGKSLILVCKSMSFQSINFSKYLFSAIYILILLSIALSVLIHFLSSYIIENFSGVTELDKTNIKNCFIILYFFIPIYFLLSVFKSILVYKYDFGFVNLFETFTNILSIINPIVFVSFYEINLQVLFFLTLSPRLCLLIILILRINYLKINITHNFSDYEKSIELINSGKWIMYLSLLTYSTVSIEKIFIGKILEIDKLTLFTISFDLSTKLMLISSAFSNTIYPIYLRNKNKIYDNNISASENTFIYIITFLCIFGIFFVNDFITIWINNDFANKCKFISETILLGVWFNSIALYSQAKLIANDHSKKLFIIQLKILIVYLIILFINTHNYTIHIAAFLWTIKTTFESCIILYKDNVLFKVIKKNYFYLILLFASYTILFINVRNINFKLLLLFIIVAILTIKFIKYNHE